MSIQGQMIGDPRHIDNVRQLMQIDSRELTSMVMDTLTMGPLPMARIETYVVVNRLDDGVPMALAKKALITWLEFYSQHFRNNARRNLEQTLRPLDPSIPSSSC